MRTDYEEYKTTGMVGAYQPERAVLRQTESGVATIFRDTACYNRQENMEWERTMMVGSRVFTVTSVFPLEAISTPTEKMLSYIDTELEKDAHST